MTKLQRITGKVFGATATATGDDPEIGQFGSALAGTYNGTTDVATIQNLAAWSNGFIDAVTPSNQYPPLPEMTGFGKVLSHQNCYLLQQGIPEWDSATTYYINNFCSKEGRVFISIQDSNLNHDPITDNLVYWREFVWANTDLSNLTPLGEKHFLNKRQITNCILESPTNINLTLKNGVLKLLKGSKFYIPNGSGNYDEYTTTSDVTDTPTFSAVALIFPMVHNDTVSFEYYVQNFNIFIGSTAPSASVFPVGITDGLWYDTVNNKFSKSTDTGTTWTNTGEIGFPIGITQAIGNGAFNIYQVFNGFGYFDNYIFYTPDVRVLAPWGRNADGSMNNIEYVTDRCNLQYFTPDLPTDSTTIYFFMDAGDGDITNIYMQDYYETPTQPIRTDTTLWYNTDYNIFDFKPQGAIGTVSWSEVPVAKLCSVEIDNGKITKLNANYPINLVDSSHSSWIAHQSMPKEGGVPYVVGASGATYTAYYDGYVLVSGYATVDTDNYLYIYGSNRNDLHSNTLCCKANYQAFCWIPISAGHTFSIDYANMTNLQCKLVPVNGGS